MIGSVFFSQPNGEMGLTPSTKRLIAAAKRLDPQMYWDADKMIHVTSDIEARRTKINIKQWSE
jgi:hypothetical protein